MSAACLLLCAVHTMGSLLVSPTDISTTEGSTATFTIGCSMLPTNDVTVPIAVGDNREGSLSTTSVTFTTANWNVLQTVTVTGVDDLIDEDTVLYDILLGPSVSGDAVYNMRSAEVHVKNMDDDTARISTAYIGTTVTTTEAAGPRPTIVFALETQPTLGVKVPFVVSDTSEASLSVDFFMFTTLNWNTPQTLTVGGVDDNIADGDQPYTITVGTCITADAKYAQLLSFTIPCVNIDDDTSGFVFSPSTATMLTTSEHLTKAFVTFMLMSEPISAVSVEMVTSDGTEGSVDPADIRVLPSTWNMPHTFTITGVNDDIDDGDVAYTASFKLAESVDPNYHNKLPSAPYSLINMDNDVVGVILSSTAVTVSEPGTQVAFTYKLRTEPVSAVTFTFVASDPSEAQVSVLGTAPNDTVTFTIHPSWWTSTFSVNVHAADDYDIDGTVFSSITTEVVSADALYDGMTIPGVAVTTMDDDVAGIVLCTEVPAMPFQSCTVGLGTTYEAGTGDELYVRLATRPTSNVVIDLNTTDIREAAVWPMTITFTAANWSTFQTVTILAVDDLLDDGDVPYYVEIISITTTDVHYMSVALLRWGAVSIDDDVDECKYPNVTCTHLCNDTNININNLNDYTCSCEYPEYGTTTVGLDATCYLDECVLRSATCTNSRQDCYDADQNVTSLDDWTCVCRSPATGTPGLIQPSLDCMYDECTDVHNQRVCASGFRPQECIDANPDPESLLDWYCNCTRPGEVNTSNTRTKAAECILDECAFVNPCPTALHTCIDINTSPYATNDWNCSCVAPYYAEVDVPLGVVPRCILDECTVPTNAAVCSSKSYQHCVDPDPDPTSRDDWVCNCTSPAVLQGGMVTRGPSTCMLDECTANQTLTGELNVCTLAVYNYGGKGGGFGHAYHQTCRDMNTSAESLNDWLCNCTYPAVGQDWVAPAICTLDECLLYSDICTNASQACFDPNTNTHDTSSENDWWCECIYPDTGPKMVGGNTTCAVDECEQYKVICESNAQTCTDPNNSSSSLDDWFCNCTAPYSGTEIGGPAECGIDECLQYSHVCISAGQLCNDTNEHPLSLQDWVCSCPPPQIGSEYRGPATCIYDECSTAPCGADQTCNDLNKNISSRSDYVCSCEFPNIGTPQAGGRAYCVQDECGISSSLCPADQKCYDASPASNDWGCECVLPLAGVPTPGGAANCTYDECTKVTLCSANGQQCIDTNLTTLGSWVCRCLPPTTGTDTNGSLSTCTWNECTVSETRDKCESQSQDCVDTDVYRHNNWECRCRTPEIGAASLGPARCTRDMCGPANVCAVNNQDCVQSGTSSLWTCVCRAPFVGEQINSVATCTINGCTQTGNAVCKAQDQECKDSTGGDWSCNCVAPLKGLSVQRAPAVCYYDECLHHTLCASKGQICIDRDTSPESTFDWMCACRPPSVGTSVVGQLAVCTLNECNGNTACQGQQCTDPNMSPDSLGDWVCSCLPPANGSKIAAAADCSFVGECADPAIRNVCESKGQTCLDSSNSAGDWQCVCPSPLGTIRATAAAAVCSDSSIEGKPVVSNSKSDSFPWAAVLIPSILVPICVGAALFILKKSSGPPPTRMPKESDEQYHSFHEQDELEHAPNPFQPRNAGRGTGIAV